MKPFWAIVKLTLRNAVRSHLFQLLLFLRSADSVHDQRGRDGGGLYPDFPVVQPVGGQHDSGTLFHLARLLCDGAGY